MLTDELIQTLSDDELWLLREAVGFFLSIAAAREDDGLYSAGTTARAETLAHDLGIEV